MDNIDNLAQFVNNAIKLGWQPQGGITFTSGWWAQALVMYEGEDKRPKKKEENDGGTNGKTDRSSLA